MQSQISAWLDAASKRYSLIYQSKKLKKNVFVYVKHKSFVFSVHLQYVELQGVTESLNINKLLLK